MTRSQSEQAPVVHHVDDDESTREATARFLRTAGHVVRTYETAERFLSTLPTHPRGCVILDLVLPGLSGLDVQRALSEHDVALPIVFLTGHGAVPESVSAMKSGAVDFLTKTVDGEVLLEAVSRALARSAEDLRRSLLHRELRSRYERLSPRERDVVEHRISGQLNKQVGFDLGIALQTTKIHRQRVLEKMEAESIVHLARMGAELGVAPVGNVK